MNDARHPELEAGILEAPESPDAYLVYGDWLLEQGEPLGELVTVQATLAKLRTRAGKAKEKRALEAREKSLLVAAEKQLGALTKYEHTWSFGFLESLVLPNPSASEYEAVLPAPATRFLRELDFDDLRHYSPYLPGPHPVVVFLAERGVPVTLRKLRIRCATPRFTRLGVIPPAFWSKLGSLRELTIEAGDFEPGLMKLPELESLSLSIQLTDAVIESLRTADLRRLKAMRLETLMFGPAATVTATTARLRPLIERWASAENLRHLGVTENEVGDELVDALLTTGLVKQLTSLDLSRTDLGDRGARTILQHAESFEQLESLNLAQNDLSDAVVAELEKRFDSVDVEEQGTRYDTIEPPYE